MNRQLIRGIKVESEHTKTINFIENYYKKHHDFPTKKSIYSHIASDHLNEDPNYYVKLNKMKL